jgi:branched-chain amino acid transport system permease protein
MDLERLRRRAPRLGGTAFGVVIAVLAFVVLALIDDEAAQSALTGVGGGTLIAALAIGVVLAYRGSGVVNIAVGAQAMYASYVFVLLREKGDLLLIAWPVHVGTLALVPALLITLAIGAAINLLAYAGIFSRLQQASAVAKLVASVGMLLILQAIIVLKFGTAPLAVNSPFDAKSRVDLPGSLSMPIDQFVAALIVIGVAVALWALFRFTRFGLATRGAAENEPRAVALGYNPLALAARNWALSGAVVSLLAVIVAFVNGSVDPTVITLLVVAGLGAALVGGFNSFGLAVVGGIGIGMGQALIQYLSTQSWFPQSGGGPLPGVQETLPFVVIVLALVIRGRGLPTRGAPESIRLPYAPLPRRLPLGMGVGTVAVVIAMLTLSSTWRLATINSLVGVCLCLSLVVLIGYVGQVSLAQLSIAGFAGFVLSRLAESAHIPFPWAPLLAILAATLLGVAVALPALRIRGVQLAAVTLAAALAIENFVFNNPQWSGGFGGASVPEPSIFGIDLGPQAASGIGDGSLPDPIFGFLCLAVVLMLALLVANLRRSSSGRRMLAVRSNERAAASLGVNVSSTKIVAFATSALVAGIGGVLSGYRFGSVTPEYFGVFQSFLILAFAYLGGISSISGAVIGGLLVTNGLVLTALDKWVGISSEYSILIGGLGLVLTVVANPDGVAGSLRRLGIKFRSRGSSAGPRRTETAAATEVAT